MVGRGHIAAAAKREGITVRAEELDEAEELQKMDDSGLTEDEYWTGFKEREEKSLLEFKYYNHFVVEYCMKNFGYETLTSPDQHDQIEKAYDVHCIALSQETGLNIYIRYDKT